MAKIEITDELKEAVFEAARAGASEAYVSNVGYVNYFKATEALLHNYKKLKALVADEKAYCEVEYFAGSSTFGVTPKPSGYVETKTEGEILEEMKEEKCKQYQQTKAGVERLTKIIKAFENEKEFAVIRLYYLDEDLNGNPREKHATWEEVVDELADAGILREIKTARRWRNRIVNDMAICLFGVAAAVSAATYQDIKK